MNTAIASQRETTLDLETIMQIVMGLDTDATEAVIDLEIVEISHSCATQAIIGHAYWSEERRRGAVFFGNVTFSDLPSEARYAGYLNISTGYCRFWPA